MFPGITKLSVTFLVNIRQPAIVFTAADVSSESLSLFNLSEESQACSVVGRAVGKDLLQTAVERVRAGSRSESWLLQHHSIGDTGNLQNKAP